MGLFCWPSRTRSLTVVGQVGTGLWRSRTRILTVLCEVDPRLWLSRTRILTVMCEVNPRLSLRRGRPGLPRITSADRWQAEFDYTIAIPLQWLHATHAHPFNSFNFFSSFCAIVHPAVVRATLVPQSLLRVLHLTPVFRLLYATACCSANTCCNYTFVTLSACAGNSTREYSCRPFSRLSLRLL